MNNIWRRFRRLIGDGGDGLVDNQPDYEANRPASQSSGNTLEPPKLSITRSRETSSLKAPKRKPRPVHRSATDTQKADDGHWESNSEEESSTARLSRRSSVLVDIMTLFRRSSSFGPKKRSKYEEDDSDISDEDEENNEKPSKERIMQMIRQKKEIIEKLRCQQWNMKRKRRTLKVTKRYISKKEAEVEKWHLYRVGATKKLTQFMRWFSNVKIYFIPWESKIRRIESHFGTVVSSFFVFLRWLVYVNLILISIICFFVVIPEWLEDSRGLPSRVRRTKHIKEMPPSIRTHADEWKTILDFGGYLQYSYIFYGYYSSDTLVQRGPFKYRVPLAYFIVNLFILGFSLFMILKKMAANARASKLQGGKVNQYPFTWKVVNGWDFSIGNPETAVSLYKANVTKLKEAMEEYNQKAQKKMNFTRILILVSSNLGITALCALAGFCIWKASQITDKNTIIKQNAVSIIVSLATLVLPNVFELIGHVEHFHPRKALRIHLARVFFLYIIAYYSLFASLFYKLNSLQAQSNILDETAIQSSKPFSIVYNPMTEKNQYEVVSPIQSESERFVREARRKKWRKKEVAETETVFSLPGTLTTSAPISAVSPWTTVFPNYGPFGVGLYNPKAIVVTDLKGQKTHKTIYESRPIGQSEDWKGGETQSLHYANSPRNRFEWRYSKYKGDICWETIMGQEITKLVITDLIMTIIIIMVIDFLRGLWVRYCNSFWCWNLEEQFPEYGEFKISENVLHLIKDQTLVWLGTIFVPLLPLINIMKLIIIMYIRGWAVMTCNVPAKQIFRASRSNNFFLILLLVMFLVSTIPVGYVIASIRPSRSCGPFAGLDHFYDVIGAALRNNLNKNVVGAIESVMSPGIIVPVLLFLLLVIYFMFSLIRGLKEANHELSEQLTQERTEEKKKIFKLAGGKRKRETNGLQRQSSEKSPVSPTGERVSLRSNGTTKSFQFEDPKEKHSLSKSPVRTPFLPSLQSVHEDDGAEDEEEPTPNKKLLKKDSTQSSSDPIDNEPPDDLPEIKLNWKDKLMIWIGISDRDKIEARYRMRQLALAYKQERYDKYQSEERESGQDSDKTKSDKQNETLEEAEYSQSTNEEYSEEPSTQEKNVRWPQGRSRKSPWPSNAQFSQEDPRDVTIINNGRESLQPGPSRQSSMTPKKRAPSSQKSTPWLTTPESAKRSHSMNDQRLLSPPYERDLASEASPLLERRNESLRDADSRLTPFKRSPPSAIPRKAYNAGSFDYTGERTPGIYHGQQAREEGLWDSDLNGKLVTSTDDPTRPPSEEGSFRDPTPSINETSGLPDDLLSYANPYSSYAAAMASPVMAEGLLPCPEPYPASIPQSNYPTAPPIFPHIPMISYPDCRPYSTLQPVDYRRFTPNRIIPPQPLPITGYSGYPSYPGYGTPTSYHSVTPVSQTRSARQGSVHSQPFTPSPMMDAYYPAQTFTPTRTPQIHPTSQQSFVTPEFIPNYIDGRNSSPSGGYQSGSPIVESRKPRFRISSSPPHRQQAAYLSEPDSGRGSGSGGDMAVRRYEIRQRSLKGQQGASTTTDDSTSPERSPTRQSVPNATHQTTV
ncbi:unnamed protein product [Bursaphelenchus xylophilus]|uniref:(pine wood nematode) hypothetical protein n=1 Tax=Bursaphelenchus xylophilus TaxID=6326 RepID=A0A1I7RQZ4_BURXY|nr:unnamed protein product [Bursaphelenchus xylophilus]CAG9130764.1 unnamed protein product [Bursaphelenchus xylophilus]